MSRKLSKRESNKKELGWFETKLLEALIKYKKNKKWN